LHNVCAEARLSRRRIDISTCACLFEFDLLENAQRMMQATLPGVNMLGFLQPLFNQQYLTKQRMVL
jgi:hypothetical protein